MAGIKLTDPSGRPIPEPDKPVPYPTFVPFGCLIAAHIHKIHEPGLAMPDGVAAPNKTPLMTVIAIGPTCVQVKPGDTILPVGTFTAINVYCDGMLYVVFREEQVSGIVDPEVARKLLPDRKFLERP